MANRFQLFGVAHHPQLLPVAMSVTRAPARMAVKRL